MSLKYRADIDGLRAIAVLVVIFFHAGIPGFSGGFVGVDVFFVISGFLITSIILNELQAGKFSIARFYERRIRRIFPALFPVIIFTVIVGAFLFENSAFKQLGDTITATTLFASNILFWSQSGYFDPASITKPLLHTWSLAVEEQFYILFPMLLLAINRFGKNRYLPWLLSIGLISLFASIYGVYSHPSITFYLVPARAWELLAGSILALEKIPLLKSNIQRNLVSATGLGLIFYSVAFYTEATLFPGANALAPVAGASFIIYSGIGQRANISRFLSIKPLVNIGLISYSLYLWHWPLIVFVKYTLFTDLTFLQISGIIIATFIISAFSLKFIEQPFRGNQPILPDRKKLFVLSGIVMFIVSIIGGVIHLQNGMEWRYPDAMKAVMSEKTDYQWIHFEENEKWLDGLKNGNRPSVIGAKGVVPSFALWGDSHAGALITALSEKGEQYGLSGFNIAHGHSVRPLIGMDYIRSDYALNEAEYNQGVLDFIRAHPEIKTVIIAADWSQEKEMRDVTGEYSGTQTYATLLRAGLFRSVTMLLKSGRNILLVSDVPGLKAEPNHVLYLANRFRIPPDFRKISPSITEYQKINKDILPILGELAKLPNVALIHPESMLFDQSGRAVVMINNQMLYIDTGHLSTYGSHYVAPAFDDLFKKMAHGQ